MERIINLLNHLQKNGKNINTEKTSRDNYSNLIKQIKIKHIDINYAKDIIINAHDAALKLAYDFKNCDNKNEAEEKFAKKVSNQYSTMSSALAIKRLPKTDDFVFWLFLCFVASCVAEHIHSVEGIKEPRMHLNSKLRAYCYLVKRIKSKLKKTTGNTYGYREEIKNLIIKQESHTEEELFEIYNNNIKYKLKNLNICNFFAEIDKQFNNSPLLFNVKKKDKDVFLEFDIQKIDSKNTLYKIIELYFNIPKQYSFIDFSFEPPISSGELSILTLWSRLYDYFEKTPNSKHAVVFVDEAETTLHPEWQKALCQNTISFIEDYCKFKNRKLHLHIIFASHSPMLMSDVPTGNVVFLDKENLLNNSTNTDWKTFSGDIFEIYQKGFFLKNGSIGSFAIFKVDDIIQRISQRNISDNDRKIIDMIGDELLFRYLKNKIDNHTSEFQKNNE